MAASGHHPAGMWVFPRASEATQYVGNLTRSMPRALNIALAVATILAILGIIGFIVRALDDGFGEHGPWGYYAGIFAFVFMISGAADCPIDNQGRSLLPQYLRDHGEFDREVTFAGVVDHVEIWSAPLLEADLSRTRAQFPQIAEVVSNLDN